MKAGKAIYGILSAYTDLTDIVSTRIYPEVVAQDAATPFVFFQITGVSPDSYKDGPAEIDEVRVEVSGVHTTYDGACDMGEKIRFALDRVSGTYSEVNVESIEFEDVTIDTLDKPRRYVITLDFTARIDRGAFTIATGSPITGYPLWKLSDVDDEITDAIDRQALVYDEETSQWIADGVAALVIPVKNTSGGAFDIGTICKAVSSQGDRITIASYSAGDDPKLLVGIANENISADADGHVLSYGEIRNVDTSTYSLGTILYPGTSGGFSTTPDTYNIPIAIVTRVHENTGRIFVRSFTPGQAAGASDLDSLSDVTITSAGSGHFLRYDGINRIWINEPVSIPSPISNTDQLAEGTTNLYYTEARVSANTDVLANTTKLAGIESGAQVNNWTEVSGNVYRSLGNVGIGTTTPSEALHVVGNVVVDGGNSNMFIGDSNTGNSITGENNIAFGNTAMRSATATSQYGVAIGSQAGRFGNQTHGMSIGFGAGYNGASSSSYVGSEAGKNAAGQRNVGIGYRSGGGASSGVQSLYGNVSIGYGAGQVLETAATAVGYLALNALTTGTGNTAVGYQAGDAATTGYDNTLLGYNSGGSIVGGYNNTGIGKDTLSTVTSGYSNTAVGLSAVAGGVANTGVGVSSLNGVSGIWNTALGMQAGYSLTGENYGTFVGGRSGRYTTGGSNTLVGYESGQGSSGVSTFSNTTAIGYQALTALTTGTANTAVGYQAGDGILAGTQNTLIGYSADISNVNGSYNVIVGDSVSTNSGGNYSTRVGSIGAVGNQAVSVGYGAGSTSGNGSISIGYNAGKGNGTFNVYVGTSAGEVTGGSDSVGIGYLSNRWTTGGSNVSIGREAAEGDATSTFSNTTAVGYQALTALTAGARNTALGYRVGAAITTGGANTLIGYEAGESLIGATYNVALGEYALANSSQGSFRVAIGAQALENATGSQGQGTVAVGFRAGEQSTGNDNVFLGREAGQTETGSNKLYIENSNSTTPLIYGEFDNDIVRVNGTLQVGDPTGTGFALPSTDGTEDQTLTTDGSGAVTWKAKAKYCQLLRSTAQTLTTNTVAWETLLYDSETIDTWGFCNPSSGAISIASPGVYILHFSGEINNVQATNTRRVIHLRMTKDGALVTGTERGTYQRSGQADGDVSIRYIYNKTDSTNEVFRIQAQIDLADTSTGNNYYFDNGVFILETLST